MEKSSQTNWRQILENYQTMLVWIQHERLIHLLITIFVGTVMIFSFFAALLTKESYLLIFSIPLIFLFLGYLFHYRFLENMTQSWYLFEEKIKESKNSTPKV